jgi:hypothetical protein
MSINKKRNVFMTTVDFEPLTVSVPIWEEPAGVFRVGKSRVLLELVLAAYLRGDSPEGIVRSYRSLTLVDVYAVIGCYLANPTPFNNYLLECEQQAELIQTQIESGQPVHSDINEMAERAKTLGLIL